MDRLAAVVLAALTAGPAFAQKPRPRVGVLLVRVGDGVAARNAAKLAQDVFVTELRTKVDPRPIASGISFGHEFPTEVRGDVAKLCKHYKVDYLLVSEVRVSIEGKPGITVIASLNRLPRADWHGEQQVSVGVMSSGVDREIQRNPAHPARKALQTAVRKLVAEMTFPAK